MAEFGTMRVKSGLAEMLKGGVIMDVVNADQAKIAEASGRSRGDGARARPGRHPRRRRRRAHVRSGGDPGDPGGRHDPGDGEVPHRPLRGGADPPGARDRLHRRVRGADARRSRASRRQVEVHRPVRVRRDEPRRGAAPDRGGRGDDPHERRGGHGRHRQRGHAHAVGLRSHPPAEHRSPRKSCTPRRRTSRRRTSSCAGSPSTGGCPVVTFTAGGIATPADASLCMQLGADGVFVGSGIFKSGDPERRAKAIVEATTHFNDAEILARVSRGSRRADGRHLDADARSVAAARDARLVEPSDRRAYAPVRQVDVRKPTWTSSSFLLYVGGFTVLSASFAALAYLSSQYGKGAYAGWTLLPLVVLYAVSFMFRGRGEWIAAGIFAFAGLVDVGRVRRSGRVLVGMAAEEHELACSAGGIGGRCSSWRSSSRQRSSISASSGSRSSSSSSTFTRGISSPICCRAAAAGRPCSRS